MSAPNKRASYDKAQAAFAAYGRLVTPIIEPLSIPFEGNDDQGLAAEARAASRGRRSRSISAAAISGRIRSRSRRAASSRTASLLSPSTSPAPPTRRFRRGRAPSA